MRGRWLRWEGVLGEAEWRKRVREKEERSKRNGIREMREQKVSMIRGNRYMNII